eukprot:4323960-Pleurochrysis_carterae.AAC.3
MTRTVDSNAGQLLRAWLTASNSTNCDVLLSSLAFGVFLQLSWNSTCSCAQDNSHRMLCSLVVDAERRRQQAKKSGS